ncbi:MAG: alpha/beta hydrolase [Desulfobacterales bacterium]|nr:alpha/beta hydrolase [Desulfobacterales bacterium]MDJ0989207.1 alpha/beta hydrolase [Desulfobacterales bacterium]
MPRQTPIVSALNAASRQVAIDGLDIHTLALTPVDRAPVEGPWLVFLHEGLGCTAMWHDFPHRLANATQTPALVYDRRGYGRSGPRRRPPGVDYLQEEAETILPALLAHFGIGTALLIGHSDGGTIALHFASRFRQRVIGVIAEAAHVFVESVTLEGIQVAVEAFEHGGLRDQLSRYHGAHTRDMFYHWADVWRSEAFRNWNIEACLPHIRCAVLVIQGLEDRYGTIRQVDAITNGIGTRARRYLIPSCGHTPHREAPRRTLAAMRRFILENARAPLPAAADGSAPC